MFVFQVGTFYGEKLYKTAPPDYHMDPVIDIAFSQVGFDTFWDQWYYGNPLKPNLLGYKYKVPDDEQANWAFVHLK